MASVLKVDKLDPQSGTALEIGTSGDTITVPSGAGLTLTDSTLLLPTTITSTTEVKTNKISPATGTAFALGDSGDTFTVPSGATIVNSGTATGFGGGKILQVVSAVISAQYSTTSTTKVATGVVGNITPASASNKVLVIASIASQYSADSTGGGLFLYTNTAAVTAGDASVGTGLAHDSPFNAYEGTSDIQTGRGSFIYLHSPSSTSAVYYQIHFKSRTGGTFYCGQGDDITQTVTLMEIEG